MIIGGLGLCAMEYYGIIFVNFDEFTSPPPRLWISNIFSKIRDFYIIINAREGGGSGIFLYYLVVMLGANIVDRGDVTYYLVVVLGANIVRPSLLLIRQPQGLPPSPLGKAKLESANIDDMGKAHRTKPLSTM